MEKNNEMMCSTDVVKTLMRIGMSMDMQETKKDVYEAYCSLERAEGLLLANMGIALEIYPSMGLLATKYKCRMLAYNGNIISDTKETYKTEESAKLAMLEKFAEMVDNNELIVTPR